MNILHVASFNGNIGDHLNHMGFRRTLEEVYKAFPFSVPQTPISYTELEMREFYRSWNLRKFDRTFAEYANQFDLLVFGGGNFFELCWDYSATGTTIDLSENSLNAITTPILFNGLGVDDKKGTVSPENIQKFGRFLEQLFERNEYITVRNDGSEEILSRYYEEKLTRKIRKIPDGGFFVNPPCYEHVEIPPERKIVAVNVAGDAANVRFASEKGMFRLTAEEFCQELQTVLLNCLKEEPMLHLVMVPHIVKDLEQISQVLSGLSDPLLRTRVSIAPCVNGKETDGRYVADLYRQSDLVLGMRYHANIAAIAVQTPTIGIVNLEKHKKMYEDIGLTDRLVPSDEPEFATRLTKQIQEVLAHPEQQRLENQTLVQRLEQKNRAYLEDMLLWWERRNKKRKR